MRTLSPKYSVRGRLLLLAVGVELLMLTFLVANSLRLLHGAMSDQTRWQVQQMMPVLSAALKAPLAQRDFATVQAVLDESRATRGIDYVVVTDREGDIVASSGWTAGAKLPAPTSTLPFFSMHTIKRYDESMPLTQSGQSLGNLHLGLNLSHIISARRMLLTQGIGIAAAELILSSLILILIGYWLTRHLSDLTKASLEVASGNLTPRPLHEGTDDVGQLGAAFNTMSRSIAERVNELTRAREMAEQSEQAKSESEKRLRAITDSAYDAILMMDSEGNISYWNPAAVTILGYTPEESIGRNLHELLSPERYLAGHRAAYPEFQRTGRGKAVGTTLELYARRKDGIEVPVSLSLSSVLLNGQWHAVGIMRDISELKRINHELREQTVMLEAEIGERQKAQEDLAVKQMQLEVLNQSLQKRIDDTVSELREKDQVLISQGRQAAMGEMIGNIAHQWRQPLNALSMLITNIQFAHRDSELTGEYLDGAAATANRLIQKMSTTINDFRNFFSPDKEKLLFSVREQVRHSVNLVEAAFKNNNIELVVNDSSDFFLEGFPNEYSQVLLNILSNAKDAIAGKHLPHGTISIMLNTENGRGLVVIRDNGGGIPENILDKIFEPYFSTKSMGTGIGLYMSKMIIERNMSGEIRARNVGEGAEFTISMPLGKQGE